MDKYLKYVSVGLMGVGFLAVFLLGIASGVWDGGYSWLGERGGPTLDGVDNRVLYTSLIQTILLGLILIGLCVLMYNHKN